MLESVVGVCPGGAVDFVDPKYSVRPSPDSDGRDSPEPLLTFGPRFTGADHASCALARVATQMSGPPRPPGRALEKYSSSASPWMYGCMSSLSLFTPATSARGR